MSVRRREPTSRCGFPNSLTLPPGLIPGWSLLWMDGIGLDINSRLRAELEHKISELRLLGAQNANLAEQAANLEREHHALLSSTTATRITAPKATCTRGHISSPAGRQICSIPSTISAALPCCGVNSPLRQAVSTREPAPRSNGT